MLRAAVSVAVLSLGVAGAQDPASSLVTSFEVVSVKPSPTADGRPRFAGRRGGPGTSDPGRWVAENMTLASLVAAAYHLRRYEYSGPAWTEEARFDITAKVPQGATREQIPLMLASLLAQRFHLRFHFDDRTVEGYALVVGKNGPKLDPSVEEPQVEVPKMSGPPVVGKDGYPELPPGRFSTSAMLPNGRMRARQHNYTMSQFATFLTNETGRPVTDATGLEGKYDITLKWTIAALRPQSQESPSSALPADPEVDSGPTVFEAVQQQLGLKLDAKRIAIRVLVIDSVDRTPSEN